jgi:hypothetical protein
VPIAAQQLADCEVQEADMVIQSAVEEVVK